MLDFFLIFYRMKIYFHTIINVHFRKCQELCLWWILVSSTIPSTVTAAVQGKAVCRAVLILVALFSPPLTSPKPLVFTDTFPTCGVKSVIWCVSFKTSKYTFRRSAADCASPGMIVTIAILSLTLCLAQQQQKGQR